MDPRELMLTAARAFAVYALMLVVIRALGKRTVGNFAAFDLLVALMLGEVVDEIIYGDVSFLQGTVAIFVIAGAQSANAWLSWWDHGWDKILEGTPTVVMRNGALDEAGMRSERMNGKDVVAHLRSQGIRDLREVELALVEDDGSISVLEEKVGGAGDMRRCQRAIGAREADGSRWARRAARRRAHRRSSVAHVTWLT